MAIFSAAFARDMSGLDPDNQVVMDGLVNKILTTLDPLEMD